MSDGTSAETSEVSKFEKKRRRFSLWMIGTGVLILLAGIFSGCALTQGNQAAQPTQTILADTGAQSVPEIGIARPTEIPTAMVPLTTIVAPAIPILPTSTPGSLLIVEVRPYLSELDGMELVFVPEGIFLMGSTSADSFANDDEFPQHEVFLDGYWIDKTEVTNAMYASFLNEMGNQSEGGETWLENSSHVHIVQTNGEWQPHSGYTDHPVVEVSWYGAVAYCEWAGRRLPTEAEWEKASRGTDAGRYPWGNADPICNLANYRGCRGDTEPAGSYPDGASPYGVLDMAGNVWEWVVDKYDEGYYKISSDSNPTGTASGDYHVLRGGSWQNYPAPLRSAYRTRLNPDNAWLDLGFRCARSQ